MLPQRIVSLWDMLELDAGRTFGALGFINTTTQTFLIMAADGQQPIIDQRDMDGIRDAASSLAEAGEGLGLSMTVAVAHELIGELARIQPDAAGNYAISAGDLVRINGSLSRLQNIKYEALSKLMVCLDAQDVVLWRAQAPFGPEVSKAYPSAEEDIIEASKCLGIERGTACVMHLMRAIEVPLKVLAQYLGIGQQNDWGSYIREIDRELNGRLKVSGKRSPDEQFYSEASAAFDVVKRAWRNRTMHVEKTYTRERAKEIFDATRSFMRHLALRIQE